ncbi:AMIN domain-containing protein [Nitrincola sp. MINF-07-Sa-05]|uniref:AMIN domain-containing protein n=1 Tax=Nitrincola salilacus TaxID=3400273 RepID=UPI003917B89C
MWIWMLTLFTMLLSGVAVAQEVQLKDANFVALPGQKIEIKLDFDSPPPVPNAYMIDNPPRLVMDFFGVTNELGQRQLDLKTNLVDSLNFAQVDGRLRVVANLNVKADYSMIAENNSLFMVFEDSGIGSGVSRSTEPTAIEGARMPAAADDRTRIRGIDFQRVEGNRGRVTITMSDDRAGLDIFEEGNNVIVNLVGAGLSDALESRLDVMDFATPVMFIDAMVSGENTMILVKPSAEPYDFMAYQTGNQLFLDFKPLTSQEQEELSKTQFPYSGERIDLNFQNVEVRTVLQILAEVAEMNLVVSDRVDQEGGTVTLRLKNVPWDQALDIILKTKSLDKRESGNVLMVGTAEEISAREQQELESQQQVQQLAPLITEYIQVDFRRASDMKTRLEEASMVSERGFVLADDQTNVLMIRETARQMEEIRRTLRRFDIEVAQVLVEARIVNASTDFSKELGIRWGAGFMNDRWQIGGSPNSPGTPFTAPLTTSSSSFNQGFNQDFNQSSTQGGTQSGTNSSATTVTVGDTVINIGSSSGTTGSNTSSNTGGNTSSGTSSTSTSQTRGIPSNLMVDLGVAPQSSIALGYLASNFLLSAELTALESDGKAEIISQPKVITTNGQTALIKAGQQIPYQTIEDGTVTIEFKDVVLSLEVTPQINPGDRLTLDIKVNQDSVGQVLPNGEVSINTNEVQTSVVVRDGDTIVLGGVFRNETSNQVSKTPLLGDLPVLGHLFRQTKKAESKRELLIFITPKMIRDALASQ